MSSKQCRPGKLSIEPCLGTVGGILAGMRVVELATVVAGPTCAGLLADVGPSCPLPKSGERTQGHM